MHQRDENEWLPLTQDYFNGEASGEDVARLSEILGASAEARAGFRRFARADLALREMAEASLPGDRPMIVPIADGSKVRRGWGGLGNWLQAAAMFVMAGALVFLLVERGRGSGGGDTDAPAGPRLVQNDDFADGSLAVLTHAVGVEWEGDLAYAEGAALRPDTIEIAKGLLQIEFFSGATVVIEGPAKFELIDPMFARCALGRVRANVPHFARGFTIESGDLKVVDLGTEFGFAAERGGAKELHVFDGEVTVEGGAAGDEPTHLLTGTGIRVEEESLDFIRIEEDAFASSELIASLASAAADEQRRAWLRYAENLKANGDVQLYYSFDNQVAWSRRLSNDKKMIADPLYGAIVGCRWAEGRWPGKAALEFKRPTDRVRISIPGEHRTMTVMAWVRIDGFDREYSSLMLSDGWEAGGAHWQVSRDGRLVFGVNPTGNYVSEPLLGQQHLGRWLHLATSYDADAGARHFVNGRQVWFTPVSAGRAIEVPAGELGNWSPGYWPPKGADVRNLNGRMDEFLVFSSALDEAGVRSIYERGRP